MMKYIQKKEGVTLLVALLLVGVLLGISTSLLNVSLKQYQLAGIAYSSEIAFQAANAGMECALYHDYPKTGSSTFAVPANGDEQIAQPTLNCMNGGIVSVVGRPNTPGTPSYAGNTNGHTPNDGFSVSGEEQNFQFDLGTSLEVCVDVSVYKYKSDSGDLVRSVRGNDFGKGVSCSQNSECTIVQSRGYNVDCTTVNAGTNPRIVEREYTLVY